MKIIDEFGFLPEPVNFESDICTIVPIKNYGRLKKRLWSYINRENFFEPPITRAFHSFPEKRRAKNRVIAWMFRPVVSHTITYQMAARSDPSPRLTELGLIVHILAYLYGCRVQFGDWFVDGFVPMEGQHNINVRPERLKDFLTCVLIKNLAWPLQKIQDFNHALIMHNRSPGYKWDWERFMMEYAVFDSLWRIDWEANAREPNHRDRIKIICEKYGMYSSNDLIEEIVNLRNDLFHEVKWDNGMPGSAKGSKGFMHSYNLRRLNQRLILAVLGFPTEYIKSKWTLIGRFFL